MSSQAFVEVHEDRVVYKDGDYVLERGPRRVTTTATAEVLSDAVTAAHYRLPIPIQDAQGAAVTLKSGKPALSHAIDALGKLIVEGESFTYLDYLEDHDKRPWYVYVRHPREIYVNDPVTGAVVMDGDEPVLQVREDNYEEVGVFDSLAEAKTHVEQTGGRAKKGARRPIPLRRSPDAQDPPLSELGG